MSSILVFQGAVTPQTMVSEKPAYKLLLEGSQQNLLLQASLSWPRTGAWRARMGVQSSLLGDGLAMLPLPQQSGY